MRVILCFLIMLSLLTSAGGAQNQPLTPKGSPPQFGMASAVLKDGKVILEVSEFRNVVRMKVEGAGDVFIEMPHWLPLTTGVLGKDIRAYRPDGKPADPQEILKALAKPRAIAYFLGYDKTKPIQPDPFYLSAFQDGGIALAFEVSDRAPPPGKP